MKKNMKKNLVSVLCATAALCGIFGVANATNAKAEATQPVTLSSFKMMDGASIRKSYDGESNGIRFSATFDDEDKAKLAGYTVTSGTFICLIAT